MECLPNIDLYNFEEDKNACCRYVLTSPRSLEACAKLNIEPVELLRQSISEFAKSHRNFPKKKLEELFDHHEQLRKAKLTKARYERSLLINNKLTNLSVPSSVGKRNIPDIPAGDQKDDQHITTTKKQSRNNAIQEQYEDIMKKLPPREFKRMSLAQKRYQQLTNQEPQTSDVNLLVLGQKPIIRPATSHGTPVKEMPKCAGLNYIDSSRDTCPKESRISSSRCSKKTDSPREIEHRLDEARERRRHLEELLEIYRRQLQETLELSRQKAQERATQRLQEEQTRKSIERRLKEDIFRQKSKELEEQREQSKKVVEAQQHRKEERVQKMLEQKEAKIQESRKLARAAQQLREDIIRAYNLDSFDRKVQKVALLNDLGLGENG